MEAIKKPLKTLYFLTFLVALSVAFPSYIHSTFINGFVDLRWVGLFFIGSMSATLITINFFSFLIKKVSNYSLAILVLIITFFATLGFITTESPYFAFLFFVILGTGSRVIWINMDVFVERFCLNTTTGLTRTIYLTAINFGWLVSPMIAGYLVDRGSYKLVYLISAFLIIPILLILILRKKKLKDQAAIYNHGEIIKTIKKMFSNKNLRSIFAVAFLLQLFFALSVIYIPLYLYETIGLSWSVLGIIFTLMLIPYIILEIPAGILADKYFGQKEILVIGFMILSASTALFYFINSSNFMVWAIILFLSRCGASLIEAMRETYFFKLVDVEDIDLINFFKNAVPFGYLVASAIGVVVLKFYPLQYIFLFLSIILLFGIYFSLRLKDTK